MGFSVIDGSKWGQFDIICGLWFIGYEGEVKSSKDRSPLDIELERFSKWFIFNSPESYEIDGSGPLGSGTWILTRVWSLDWKRVDPKQGLNSFENLPEFFIQQICQFLVFFCAPAVNSLKLSSKMIGFRTSLTSNNFIIDVTMNLHTHPCKLSWDSLSQYHL